MGAVPLAVSGHSTSRSPHIGDMAATRQQLIPELGEHVHGPAPRAGHREPPNSRTGSNDNASLLAYHGARLLNCDQPTPCPHPTDRCIPSEGRPLLYDVDPRPTPGVHLSGAGYFAGRNATWIWAATPGAVKPKMSLVL
jgi:hypothetical protein